MQTKGVGGAECIILMGLCMKGSGLKIREMEKDFSD